MMKKLLLLIVPLLLLGVSFADTWSLDGFSTMTTCSSYAGYGPIFFVAGASGNTISLYSGVPNNNASHTCNQWDLYNQNNTLVKTGAVDCSGGPCSGAFVVDYNVSAGQFYRIALSKQGGGACNVCRGGAGSNVIKFIPTYSTTGNYTVVNLIGYGASYTNASYAYSINGLTFSGVDPRIPPDKTIRYNGTSTGFGGSNIYLNGTFGSVASSGVDLVFTYLTNFFRSMFRQHP